MSGGKLHNNQRRLLKVQQSVNLCVYVYVYVHGECQEALATNDDTLSIQDSFDDMSSFTITTNNDAVVAVAIACHYHCIGSDPVCMTACSHLASKTVLSSESFSSELNLNSGISSKDRIDFPFHRFNMMMVQPIACNNRVIYCTRVSRCM